ncbi:unnamed protein product, partial [Tetraodon nigroviridis]
QKQLKEKWARWSALFTNQPVIDVKSYFGEKVALYYLWLGWYTWLLVPASILGVIVFLYGLAFFNTNPLIREVCESNITMCPRCDKTCKVWQLSDTCTYAKISHLFDNEGTVGFAMFMAIWATLFLELWKRHRAIHVTNWKVYDWCEEEVSVTQSKAKQHLKPCSVSAGEKTTKNHRWETYFPINSRDALNFPHKTFSTDALNACHHSVLHSYLRSTVVLILVTLMVRSTQLIIQPIVLIIWVSFKLCEIGKNQKQASQQSMSASVHHFKCLKRRQMCLFVSQEKTNSFAATERSFTVKMFTFQFFTLFSSLFYVAFFLGRINGHPGNYKRIAGWRLEECHPSGCLTDLFIQMSIIMLLKQTLNNIFEFTVPWVKNCLSRSTANKLQRKCGQCYRKTCRDENGCVEPCDICKLQDWLRNYHLANTDAFSLFNEFMEMVMQFSFTTIFVAAFPLAPLLALINNIFEIRLDAIKMVRLERRMVPRKTNDIGVWTQVLEAIGVLAVIANGLVIGFSSDFIPRLVYHYHFGPCATGSPNTHCMQGYINDTLSTALVLHSAVRKDFDLSQLRTENGLNVTQCSYRDYRNNEDYTLTTQFWIVLAVRFAFVILFEHVVVVCKSVVSWFVPNNPNRVKNKLLKDKLERFKEELREMKRMRSTEV